ncbi:MAG TPA: hypothetical protein PLD59_13080, partial [Tepidisphaeraceae bacterium]|nr:hypothetical protein [Tepidisphaeraceae bacterium]
MRLLLVLPLLVVAGCSIGRAPDTAVAPLDAGQTFAGGRIESVTPGRVHRVTTAVPFPRGLAILDGKLAVLARGRVRESGGTDAAIDDQAGTIFLVDPDISEPIGGDAVSEPVRANGAVVAAPT